MALPGPGLVQRVTGGDRSRPEATGGARAQPARPVTSSLMLGQSSEATGRLVREPLSNAPTRTATLSGTPPRGHHGKPPASALLLGPH